MKTYLIYFGFYLTNGYYESKKIKVHHCMSGAHVQVRLENHLKKTVANFDRMTVYSCTSDLVSELFNDIFSKVK